MLPIPSMLLLLILGIVTVESPPKTAPADEAPKMVRFTDKAHGFSFDRPENWEKTPNPNENIVVMFRDVLSGPGDKVRDNISVVVTDLGPNADAVTMDTVLPAVRAGLKKRFSEFSIVEDGPAKLAGQDAHKLVYTAKMQGVDLKFVQVMSIANSKFYTVTFTSSPDGFSKYQTVLAAMLESFRFEP